MIRRTDCPACGKRIAWMPTKTGGFVPVDEDKVPIGFTFWNGHKMQSHYNMCDHSKDNKREAAARGRCRTMAQRYREKEVAR